VYVRLFLFAGVDKCVDGENMNKSYVEKRGKIYARVCYRDSQGKRRQIWRAVETKSAAKDKVLKLHEELDEFGTESFEHDLTMEKYLDRWLKSAKKKLSLRTYDDYASLLDLHVRPVLGKHRLSRLRPLDFQSFVDSMTEKDLSPRTVRYAHTVVSSAMKQAVRWKLMTHNPAQFVELPKAVKREVKALSVEQAKAFLKKAETDEFGLLFELALVTGMRPEEYLALEWGDLEGTSISIKRVLVSRRQKSGWYFQEPKTKKSRRSIVLPGYLVNKLKAHRGKQLEYRLKRADKYQNHNLIFASKKGSPVSIRNLERRHFKPILEAAGLPDIRLYDLRHSCATLLLMAGEHPKVVSERLGHSSIVITLDTYSAVLPTMQEQATEKLAALLGS
jgi:integrase